MIAHENEEAFLIWLGLKNADSGQDLYDALYHVPERHLKQIKKIISHILKNREDITCLAEANNEDEVNKNTKE